MSLLGTPLLVLAAVAAALLPLATAFVWSRVRGGQRVRFAQRLALVLVCQVAGVAFIAIGLNDYGNFYGSWASLLNGQPQGAQVHDAYGGSAPKSGLGRTSSPGRITLLADPPYAAKSQWSTRGRLESVELHGSSSALQEHAFVYLPPQYFQPAYANTRFPALEVMSGYPGYEPDMTTGMNYPGVLLGLIEKNQAAPTVLVMLLPSVTYPHDTECTNVPNGPQAATFYFSDLPSQVSQAYRVLPHGWGAIGGSTGAYCAVKFAMLHPDVCFAAVSIEGYFFATKDNTTGDLWGGSSTLRNLNDLEWRLRNLPAPPVSVLLTSTYDEFGPFGYHDSQLFASLAKSPMTVRTIIRPHGGHNIATWRVGLASELSWLIGLLPPPTAHP